MNKKRFFLLKGIIYPYDTVVCLGVSKEEILQYMEKNYIDSLTSEDKDALEMPLNTKGRTLRLKNNAYILWTKYFPVNVEHFETLNHEIFHTSDMMLRKAGLSLSDDSDEAWAYMIGWMTREIYKNFKLCKIK